MVFDSRTTSQSADFIKRLQKERTDYKYASQVRTIANSLMQLSVGIYTEPERFVYELLQNSVDAFTDTGKDTLDILIKVEGDRFLFMHNGKPFTERDVEGISDVGNGTKANDSKKIGYKGIGFKSVFMPSVERVAIISGDFCFEFNKDRAFSLMPSFPQSEKPLSKSEVPWQVIPIDSPELKSLEVQGFNVVTIVYTSEAQWIASKIEGLFSNLQFLLFLRSNNVNIAFERNGSRVFSIGKRQTIDSSSPNSATPIVTLVKNGIAQSQWMLFSDDVSVPSEVKGAINRDFNTPDKLKGAEKVEISFAVQIDKDKVVPVEDAAVFTFLPTSYKRLKQHFLINSNFITDAGRQQLHQESEWNKLIFSKIPELYLRFVSTFSSKYHNFFEVLPKRYPESDTLVGVYREAMASAFSNIAFVPNKKGNKLLKLRDVLFDETGISNGVIAPQTFFKYFNKKRSVSFSEDNLVENQGVVSYAHDIVYLFGRNDLYELLGESSTYQGWNYNDDFKIVNYLYSYYKNTSVEGGRDSFLDILRHLPFILDETGEWKCPVDLYFPSDFREQNQQAQGVSFIDNDLLELLSQSDEILAWFKDDLGVGELDNYSFVKYICSHPDYITVANAIDVGLFLFKVWKERPQILENNIDRGKIKLLTKKRALKTASELFLPDAFEPKLKLEQTVDEDIFPAADYCIRGEEDRLKVFFKVLGISEDIELKNVHERLRDINSSRFDYVFFHKVSQTSQKWGNTYSGFKIGGAYTFIPSYITYPSYSLLYLASNYYAAKTILTRVFAQPIPQNSKDITVFGVCGFWDIRQSLRLLSTADTSCPKDYLQWVFENCSIIPTTLKRCQRANTVYAYSESTYEIAGKYHPVFDAGTQIDDSWRQLLPFKQNLSLTDLLSILENIAFDEEEEKDDKKERVSRIYREIIDRGQQCSPEIAEWAESHSLLSQSGEFLPASELTFITVDGFKNGGSKIYCEKVGQGNREKLLQLLKTFGVKVITPKEIKPSFNKPIRDDELKRLLLDKLLFLTIFKKGTDSDFEKGKESLKAKIEASEFFKCEEISLTYGEEEDTIQKTTFFADGRFYYTGKINMIGVEPLLSPLCGFLGLASGTESELLVILFTEDSNVLVDYLKDKGYQTSYLSTLLPPAIPNKEELPAISSQLPVAEAGGTVAMSVGNDAGLATAEQKAYNEEAKRFVKQELEVKGYEFTKGLGEYSTIDGVVKDGIEYPLVVKSYKYDKEPIKIGANEWLQLMKKNSVLLVYQGENRIGWVDIRRLLLRQDHITLSFSTQNIEAGRLYEFAQLLHYFTDIHFDFTSINPYRFESDSLADCGFNGPRRKETDTADDDENDLM